MTMRRSTFQAIGTKWEFQVQQELTDEAWERLLQRLYLRIDAFDAAYSRFRADSLVTTIARRVGTYSLPADGYGLLLFYENLYQATDGKVTPLIGQAMSDAGYDAAYSFEIKPVTTPPSWEDVLQYDQQSLTVKRPVLLDFGAAGKGYLIDILSELISKAGIHDYVLNAGGDILQRSSSATALEVGLENPRDITEAIGIVRLTNQSICASSGTKRQWGTFNHIIDPTELVSPAEVIATWVIADDTMTADGLATALFFTDPDQLQTQFDFSYAVLTKDMSLQYAKDFPVTLFAED